MEECAKNGRPTVIGYTILILHIKLLCAVSECKLGIIFPLRNILCCSHYPFIFPPIANSFYSMVSTTISVIQITYNIAIAVNNKTAMSWA